MEEKRPHPVLLTIVLLLVIPLIYAGSYLALLSPDVLLLTKLGEDQHGDLIIILYTAPIYRIESSFVETIFKPANWVDKRLRPQRWQGDGAVQNRY
jgi:hypothetical protein